jgi:hypothetical protein
MHAFMGRNGRALILALALAAFGAVPAAAQRQQARQQAQRQQINDDFRLSPELGFEYRLSPQWRLTFDTRLFLNQAMSNVQKLEMQPGVEYALSPNWSVAGGYIQYQRLPAQVSTTRGPYEDVTYGTTFGRLEIANRLRTEELFYDNNGALLIRTRYRLSLQHPIPETPWAVLVSNELYLNLKTDGTTLPAGYDRNKLYGGLVVEIGRGAKASAGYELTSYEPRGDLRQVHTLRLGFAFALN